MLAFAPPIARHRSAIAHRTAAVNCRRANSIRQRHCIERNYGRIAAVDLSFGRRGAAARPLQRLQTARRERDSPLYCSQLHRKHLITVSISILDMLAPMCFPRPVSRGTLTTLREIRDAIDALHEDSALPLSRSTIICTISSRFVRLINSSRATKEPTAFPLLCLFILGSALGGRHPQQRNVLIECSVR